MYGLDGCEPMGLDDELAIAFIYNTAKQDTPNQHPHVILRVNINTMPTLHVVTLLPSFQPQPRYQQTPPLTPTNTSIDDRQERTTTSPPARLNVKEAPPPLSTSAHIPWPPHHHACPAAPVDEHRRQPTSLIERQQGPTTTVNERPHPEIWPPHHYT